MKTLKLAVCIFAVFGITCACAYNKVIAGEAVSKAGSTGESNTMFSNSVEDIIDDIENTVEKAERYENDSEQNNKSDNVFDNTGSVTESDNNSYLNTKLFNMVKVESPEFEPVYVYADSKKENLYSPTGWMGDVGGLQCLLDSTEGAFFGLTCIKISYLPTGGKQWAGIYWQHPANNWGDKNGGYNLIGATKLTFWARGEKGNEIISEAKIGGISGAFADSDVAWIKGIRLSKKWKQYSIDLSKSDLSYISGGFCVVFTRKDNPEGCTIFLDEIKYE